MRKLAIVLNAALVLFTFGLSQSAKLIEWYEAPKYYGQWVTVRGKVVSTEKRGRLISLNFGPSAKGHLVVLIFRSSLHRFPPEPENFYNGKELLVTGKIQKYKGIHSITIPDQSRIRIVEESGEKMEKKAKKKSSY